MIKDQTSQRKLNNMFSFSYREVREQITEMLAEPVKFGDEENLLEFGLDSLKIMRLVNKWRRGGAQVTFADLISTPCLKVWWEMLNKSTSNFSEITATLQETQMFDTGTPFPLTDVQYAYWIGRRDEQPLGGVGCHAYLELDGKNVDPERLSSAWQALMDRHGMLRARFLPDGQQEIMETSYNNALTVNDLCHCPENRLGKELETIRERLSHRRLQVEKGDVAGLELSLLPGGSTRLHFDIDLLVADVQSLQIILRDLAAAYNRNVAPPAPADWHFGNYLSQKEKRQAADMETSKQYWKERLPQLPVFPSLPLKEKPEAIVAPMFKRRVHLVSIKDWKILKSQASARQLTPAMVLLTAYADILGRWSTTSRFLINVPLFDRPTDEPGVEDVVADFSNLLLLSVDTRVDQSFLDRCRIIQDRVHHDIAYISYSGVRIQRDMARFYPGQRTFAPVVFACNLGTALVNEECREALGKLSYMISQTPQVWLDFQIYEESEGLLLCWDAVEGLFPDGMIDEMFNAYVRLMAWITAADDNWESSFDALPESRQYLRNQEATRILSQTSGYPQCIHIPFFEFAAAYPGQTALIDTGSDTTVTYGELAAKALRIAGLLKKRGVTIGDPVAVTLPRGMAQIAGVMGVLASGACYVPISTTQPATRRKQIHKKAGICYALTDTEHSRFINWPAGTRILDISDNETSVPLTAPALLSPRALAYIIFTSGSTGEPKGVEIEHGSAWNTIGDINQRWQVGASDRGMAISALDFDLSVYDIFGLLGVGASLVLITDASSRDAAQWMDLVNKYHVTLWNSVPILLEMLLVIAEGHGQPVALPLRLALLSGDWISLDIPERLYAAAPNCRLIAMGGATEASIWSNFFEVTLPLSPDLTSIPYGRPLNNQAYRVIDENGWDCPDWVAGELWIGGGGVARGYRNEPELTADRFVTYNGSVWYRTGDMGRYLPDGNIEFLGRKDFQVKIRGHRIELGEIESALRQHPNVRDAVVTAVGDPMESKFLVGFVVPNSGVNAGCTQESLFEFLGKTVPDYMVPPQIVSLDKLPLTTNGKVDRKQLTLLATSKKVAPQKKIIAPRNDIEAALVKIWQQLLETSQLSVVDSFFELGGDSLIATRMTTIIRSELEVDLPLGKLFESPTIAALGELIQGLKETNEARVDSVTGLPQLVPDPDRRHYPFPLTDIQHAYWIGRSGAYSLGDVATHFYFEIENTGLDIERITLAWQRLITHHDMMRAVIMPDGKQQKILETVPPYRIEIEDLRGNSPGETARRLEEIRVDMSHQILSPDTWPLFHIKASRFDDDRIRLHIDFDNLIFDGWSIFHLLHEWTRLYNNLDASLPSHDLSFRDYVLALEDLKKSELYQQDWEYWSGRLTDLPPAPDLPLAVNPKDLTNQRFKRLDARLDKDTWQQLKQLSMVADLTPSGILLAAYAEILGTWSKHPRFTINLTQFNRLPLHPQVNDVVGDFTSLTLLAIDNVPGRTFMERCRSLQRQLWQDLDHPYLGGVQVQRELARHRGQFQGAVMPIVFTSTLGIYRDGDDDFDGKWLGKLVYNITQTPQVWLDHQVLEQDGDLVLIWDFVEGLFPEGMLDDMFAAYYRLLENLARKAEAWQAPTLDLIPAYQLELRARVNDTRAEESPELLHTLFDAQAAERPDQPAVITSDLRLSYDELLTRSGQVAGILKAGGVRPNILVAVFMEKGWEQVVATLGILQAGAAYLPIDPNLPHERIVYLLDNADVSAVLTQARLEDRLSLPDGIAVIPVDGIDRDAGVFAPGAPVQQQEDLAYVIYTSGSTGVPKGVMIDHRGAVNTIMDITSRFGIQPGDRVLAVSSLSFDLSVYDIFGILAAGGTIVLPDSNKTMEPAHWAEWIDREKITIWNTVPMMMQMLTEHAAINTGCSMASLRLVMMSGDWIPLGLPAQIAEVAASAEIVSLGGATEASIWSILYPVEYVDEDWKSIPYGSPMANQFYYVLDENLDPCPTWVTGSLFIGGIGLAKGYWRDKEKTDAAFFHHPRTGERLYRTGDMGRYFPDGNIEFLGREDSQVKISGYRVELGEIESVLKQHQSVREAVVITEGTPPALAAAVLFDPGDNGAESDGTGTEAASDIQAFLRTQLPAYMVPQKIAVMESFFLNTNGKVDRKAIAGVMASWEAVSGNRASEPPKGELEQLMAEIWCRQLGISGISREDDFFQIGGDSLKATRIVGELQTQRIMPAGMPLRTFFTAPTIAAFTEQIRQMWGQEAQPQGAEEFENIEEGVI